jgi:hypothetical protein
VVEEGAVIARAAFGEAARLGVPIAGEQGCAWPVRVDGQVRGWLKRHGTAAAARREREAVAAMRAADGDDVAVVDVLAVDGRWMLTSHAPGAAVEQDDDTAWTRLGAWCARLRALPAPADALPLARALTKRWNAATDALGWVDAPPDPGLRVLARYGRGWAHRDLRPDHVRQVDGRLTVFDAGQARPDHRYADAVVVQVAAGDVAVARLHPEGLDEEAWRAARRLHALATWAWAIRHGDVGQAAAARARWLAIG